MQTRTWRSCTPRDVAADPGQPAQTLSPPTPPNPPLLLMNLFFFVEESARLCPLIDCARSHHRQGRPRSLTLTGPGAQAPPTPVAHRASSGAGRNGQGAPLRAFISDGRRASEPLRASAGAARGRRILASRAVIATLQRLRQARRTSTAEQPSAGVTSRETRKVHRAGRPACPGPLSHRMPARHPRWRPCTRPGASPSSMPSLRASTVLCAGGRGHFPSATFFARCTCRCCAAITAQGIPRAPPQQRQQRQRKQRRSCRRRVSIRGAKHTCSACLGGQGPFALSHQTANGDPPSGLAAQ